VLEPDNTHNHKQDLEFRSSVELPGGVLRGRQLAIFDRICIQGNTKELADSMPPVQVILKLGMDENLICAHPDPCRGTRIFVEGQKTLPEQGRCPY
jgi:hypothetical protein